MARTGRTLTTVPADRPAQQEEATKIALETARTHVDPLTEWAQAFEEDGRLIRDVYVRADMGGVDWDAVLDRYRPLVDRLGCYDDSVDLLWEVHGELGCSHAYEDWAQNRDPHLEAAVHTALTHLTAQPPATPPRPTW